MKTPNKASSQGFTLKYPKKHFKQLLFIVVLVVLLPVLALAARLVTNLTPRAFLPETTPISCPETLKKYSFSKPCRVSTTTTVTPTGTITPIPRTTTTFPTTAERAYFAINYTCDDGYSGVYESKACLSSAKLLATAPSICTERTLIKDINFLKPCTNPSPNYTGGTNSYYSVSYTCADGYTGRYNSLTCLSETQLRTTVLDACRSHSTCSTVSVTLTKTPTPIPPITTTTTISPTGGVGRPTIMIPPPVNVTDEVSNRAPNITTPSLPIGYVNTSYNASIDATDYDRGDTISMTISGLPFGLSQGPCAVPINGGRITCMITGTPSSAGIYTVRATATDSKGGVTGKTFNLSIYEGTSQP